MPTALLLTLAVAAHAGAFATCVKKTRQGFDEPKTLAALLRCQARNRQGKPADEDSAHAEVRDYLARHPERASTEDDGGGDAGLKPEVAAQKRRSREAVKSNARRLPEDDRAGLEGLNEELWEMSGNGRLGVTPEMAKEIAGYLQKQQGGVSVEMSDLLQTLSEDGAKLSHGSVRKLKQAAREAKGEGLDLGVADESTQNWLLDPATDPEPGAKGPYPGQEDPGPPVN